MTWKCFPREGGAGFRNANQGLKKHEGLGGIELPQTTQPKETWCFPKIAVMTGNSDWFLCFVGLIMASRRVDGFASVISNNSEPDFTDDEVLTCDLFARLRGLHQYKIQASLAIDFWLCGRFISVSAVLCGFCFLVSSTQLTPQNCPNHCSSGPWFLVGIRAPLLQGQPHGYAAYTSCLQGFEGWIWSVGRSCRFCLWRVRTTSASTSLRFLSQHVWWGVDSHYV